MGRCRLRGSEGFTSICAIATPLILINDKQTVRVYLRLGRARPLADTLLTLARKIGITSSSRPSRRPARVRFSRTKAYCGM
jgi:hypothetical protein